MAQSESLGKRVQRLMREHKGLSTKLARIKRRGAQSDRVRPIEINLEKTTARLFHTVGRHIRRQRRQHRTR